MGRTEDGLQIDSKFKFSSSLQKLHVKRHVIFEKNMSEVAPGKRTWPLDMQEGLGERVEVVVSGCFEPVCWTRR